MMPATKSSTKLATKSAKLDPLLRRDDVLEFEEALRKRIVGQNRAVSSVTKVYETVVSGLAEPRRPLASLLFLGPSGVGKTRCVEALAEVLFGNPEAVLKVDCAEYQHGHEVAKLVGAPAGYLGHRETGAILSKERLEFWWKEDTKVKVSLLLFDEIEKAHFDFYQILLGILDKALISDGRNVSIDFSQTIIFMTSNLGTSEINKELEGRMGFGAKAATEILRGEDLERKVYHTAKAALARRFSPEFLNRIDKTVVFHALTSGQLDEILDLELAAVQERVMKLPTPFVFRITLGARRLLLEEGYDQKFGARHLRRAIHRFVTQPLARISGTGQIAPGDLIEIGQEDGEKGLSFERIPQKLAVIGKK